MEPLRLGLLAQQQRHLSRIYEAAPTTRPWERPGAHSLPPPADPQPKTQQKQADTPVLTKGDSKVGLVRRPLLDGPKKGQMYWQYPLELLAEAEQMLARGVPRAEVARCTDVSYNAVVRIERQMKLRAAPAPMQLIASAPATEPQRLHILDWGRRMAGYEFSMAPEHCQPQKARSHSKGMTHSQINSVLRSNHAPTAGMSINSGRKPRVIAQSIAQLFGGGGSGF